jgi:hypothetical protein
MNKINLQNVQFLMPNNFWKYPPKLEKFKDFQELLYKLKNFQVLEFLFPNSRTFTDFQFLYQICLAMVTCVISYIKVLLVCDWLISVQLIPNSSAKICNHSAIFCNHYEPIKIELSFGGENLKIFFFQKKTWLHLAVRKDSHIWSRSDLIVSNTFT